MKNQMKFVMLLCTAVLFFSLTSCEKDEEIVTPKKDTKGLIVLDSYSVDFGVVTVPQVKSTNKEVVVKLTNKSESVLTGLKSSITFPGQAGVKFSFKALQPGDSMDVTFTYSPAGLEPGEYTGTAKLIPSIGDTIVVDLKATVVTEAGASALIVLDSYLVDFGIVEATSTKSTEEAHKEVVLTLTNNSNSVLTGLKSSINFPGNAGVKMSFSALQPGESMSVPFTFSPAGLSPGEYTGSAKLIPSIGDTIEVELKATVVADASALIVLDSYFVDFGSVEATSTKSTEEAHKEVVLTLTNNSNSVLTGLKSSINFPGNAGVKMSFSALQPGESMSVPFTFSPAGLSPGEYTGSAKLIPSIGDTIEVELKATVVAPSTGKPVTLSTYFVDFGEVATNAKSLKSTNNSNSKTVVVTITNNSDEVLSTVGSKISFPGSCSVNFSWKPLQPGESSDFNFKFSPSTLQPGEYTGTATITPSIGDPIIVDLKATVVADN